MSHGAVGRLEGLRAKRTLVEDFAVFLVDVHFEHGQGHEDNSTMDAPGEAWQRAELQPQHHFQHTRLWWDLVSCKESISSILMWKSQGAI